MATNHECQPELIVYLDSKILDNKRKQKCSQMENENFFVRVIIFLNLILKFLLIRYKRALLNFWVRNECINLY